MTNEDFVQLFKGIFKPNEIRRVRFFPWSCPLCGGTVEGSGCTIGRLVSDELTRDVLYLLCEPCGQRRDEADPEQWLQLTDKIERYLEAAGVFIGIRQGRLKA